MKNLKRILALALAMGIIACFAGCANNDAQQDTSKADTTLKAVESTTQKAETTQKLEIKNPLYIGTKATGFKQYESNIDGEPTPEKLISAIADLTGWNLKLADTVTTGKGGMTVTFSKDSFVKLGPPEKQKEEFFCYDNYTFVSQVLSSIQKTLQMNYVEASGDPNSLDIYFSVEDEPITVENVKIPMDRPWNEDVLK